MDTYTITIDGGTTNTRCILWNSSRQRIDEQKREVGVRNTAIDGNNSKLKNAVKECLEQLLEDHSLTYDNINHIIASGMITSDVGIVVVPHLTAPADLEQIARSTVAIRLPEICPIPIHFIPGIKNSCSNISLENYEAMDIMRGEEVESLAIIDKYHNGSPMILVLPGSHNKFVAVNADKEITGCLTSISGELLSAIINDTIIAKSVNRSFVTADQYDRKWLLLGYNTAKETGLGRACFSGRILGLFCNAEPSKISNYILGAALQGDIQAIRNSSALCVTDDTQFVVFGKDPFKQALVDIFTEEKLSNQITIFEPEAGFSASALGAYLVAEKCKII